MEAKLQHPLDVAWAPDQGLLYVADSYNHKVRFSDVVMFTCPKIVQFHISDNVIKRKSLWGVIGCFL